MGHVKPLALARAFTQLCGPVLQAVYHSFGSRELKEVMKQQHGRPHEQAAAQRSGDAPPSSDILTSNRNLIENYLRWALPACAALQEAKGRCSGTEGDCMLMCLPAPLGQAICWGIVACRQCTLQTAVWLCCLLCVTLVNPVASACEQPAAACKMHAAGGPELNLAAARIQASQAL